jgi:ligand-binding SRPBCC domain-containing protein
MTVHLLEREQFVRRPLAEVFEFFSAARNLERLTPPWLRFQILTPEPIAMRAGTRIDYRLTVHGVPVRWTSRIESWEPGVAFVDRQEHGPYRLWHHRHEFEALGEGTLVRDLVRYALPLGPLGRIGRILFVQRDLDDVFAYRRLAVSEALSDGDR